MANTKISALTEVTAPLAADVVPIVSGGATKKCQLGNLKPYKVYVALLNQTGTDAPVATVLENTLGGTLVWTRSDVGQYVGTLSGVFSASKTWAQASSGRAFNEKVPGVGRADANAVNLINWDTTGQTYADGMFDISVEIRVYP